MPLNFSEEELADCKLQTFAIYASLGFSIEQCKQEVRLIMEGLEDTVQWYAKIENEPSDALIRECIVTKISKGFEIQRQYTPAENKKIKEAEPKIILIPAIKKSREAFNGLIEKIEKQELAKTAANNSRLKMTGFSDSKDDTLPVNSINMKLSKESLNNLMWNELGKFTHSIPTIKNLPPTKQIVTKSSLSLVSPTLKKSK